ncbi:GNAT family N-acetyltransferase [Streptococcus saliviloxodontae]|uniref:N-acetyltransferase YhbS n=1 Tax=Streptococcus saliviloxodontae TaxID=1349416 RepID=A0ABS2PN69_9STRE|nr:N-acetyltransferase [Streptococcus saliviloxodontae]MBM7636879.1 putative N-acetyltransferase YhbS [Streptococcus saliviloxodontae]
MLIRRAKKEELPIIAELVASAFKSAEHSDGNEHDLVLALCDSSAFIPELSLVAELNGKLIGHILFTKASVAGQPVLVLAPVSVLPDYQGKGVGTALIETGHQIAKDLGYAYISVLGSDTYYPRFGYLPATRYGISAPFKVADEYFMMLRLTEEAPECQGQLCYPSEFGIDD